MGALFGEECYYLMPENCSFEGERNCRDDGEVCKSDCVKPAHVYHTLEAVKRIFSESAGIEAAIDYLWEEINK
jgi:hypothetical protein